MVAPAERRFVAFERGVVRDDIILASFRNSLRVLINPETGSLFTEDEIQRATQPGSRFYIDAESIDLLTQAYQSRSIYLSSQQDPRLANTSYLDNFHGRLWLGEDSRLPATGGSVEDGVDAVATPGNIFPGSTTVPDPAAAVATDPNGFRYQVLQTVVTPASGTAILSMRGIDTGVDTNPIVETILTWSANQPGGAEPQCIVTVQFSGGFDEESNADYANRIEQRIRYRPASGNNAHFVAWARESNVSVEDAFVYSTALHAGSVLVAITQKRGSTLGPEARTNVSAGTLTDATNYLVPPNSPVVPQRAFVIVTAATAQESDLVLRLALNTGASGGWFDVEPWPTYSTTYPQVQVTNVTSQVNFDVQTDAAYPGGVAGPLTGDDVPALMLWNKDDSVGSAKPSRWERLDVASVTKSGVTHTIVLNSQPSFTIATGDRLSPYTDRLTVVAEALEDYFDSLGPGEVVDLTTDTRAARAFRYPTPSQESPSRAGQSMLAVIIEALGGLVPDAELTYISRNEPDLPGDISDGPNIVTLGDVNIHPL
jgi:hypothetical protein